MSSETINPSLFYHHPKFFKPHSTTIYYSLLDLKIFRTAVTDVLKDTFDLKSLAPHKNQLDIPLYLFTELKDIIIMYNKRFPKGRIPLAIENALVDLIRSRISQNRLTFLPATPKQFEPINILLGMSSNELVPIDTDINKIRDLLGLNNINVLISDFTTKQTAGNIYLSTDGKQKTESYNLHIKDTSDIELNRLLFKMNILTTFTLDNWLNISLSTGSRAFPNDVNFNMFHKCYSSNTGVPTLFKNITMVNWFRKLVNSSDLTIEIKNARTHDIEIMFDKLEKTTILNIDYSFINFRRKMSLTVATAFLNIYNDSQLKYMTPELYANIIHVNTTVYDSDISRTILAVMLKFNIPFIILSSRQAFDHLYSNNISRLCYNILTNDSVFIASPKGSGKSTIAKLFEEKGYYVIDSDVYGQVLTALDHETEFMPNYGNYKTDYTLLSNDIYNLTKRDDFENFMSKHEYLASKFIDDDKYKNIITINNLLIGKVPQYVYDNFSEHLYSTINKTLNLKDYFLALGYIPEILYKIKGYRPKLIIFCHNTMELFASMTTATYLMESNIDSLMYMLFRENRHTSALVQMFLLQYYLATETYIASSIPVYFT